MAEKNTDDLELVLGKTHISNFEKYLSDNKESVMGDEAFSVYVKELFHEKKISQQMVFLKADIPERYGYKLLSGEKRTRQRDIILRICYAAEFSMEETQRALSKYGMPRLYAKDPRDALIMIIFNDRPGSVIDVNEVLRAGGFDALRSCGLQE